MWPALDVTILEVVLGLVILLWLVYKYFTWDYTYWKDRSVPYVEPYFPFGTDKDIILRKASLSQHYRNLYNKHKNEKIVGGYALNKPYLLIRDPELIKRIVIKDFHYFVDRSLVDPELLSPLSRGLFDIEGEYWKKMRTKLTPAFSSGKMKLMFNLMEACVDEFKKVLHPVADQNGKLVDVKDFIARFTTDVISSCAFGLESNSVGNPNNEFRRNGNKILAKPTGLALVKMHTAFFMPKISKLLGIVISIDEPETFFKKIVNDTIKYREKSGEVRNDFIDMLLKIKNNKSLSDDHQIDAETVTNNGNPEEGLTLDEMTAQAILFFAAGFETAASTLTFCLYELALNPSVQEKLSKEIDGVLQKHSGKVNYQALQEMPYLDAVINETLRRYTSLGFLIRKCTEDYSFLDSGNLVIPKGMTIVIPTYGIHHDPEYYPDPFKFDPERFMNDAIKTKGNFTFLPFGEGPRMCIGSRFALLQMKTCLSMMIHNFEFSVTEGTPIPLELDKVNFVTSPETPIVLKITNRIKK